MQNLAQFRNDTCVRGTRAWFQSFLFARSVGRSRSIPAAIRERQHLSGCVYAVFAPPRSTVQRFVAPLVWEGFSSSTAAVDTPLPLLAGPPFPGVMPPYRGWP